MSRQEWLSFRTRGLGASDISTVLGLNQYKASIELFYEKLSLTPAIDFQNISKFMGLQHEDKIAEMWQYWEGTEDSIIRNYDARKIVRKCQKVNAYIQNPKYPWLFVSLDRKINKTSKRGEGALELKTMAGFESKKWTTDVPPGYLVQIQDQILVCEFEYGELGTMTDGRFFNVIPFERRKELEQQIIERTKIFWDSVIEGRKLLTKKYEAIRNHNMKAANDFQAQLEMLEPEPDGSEAYERFLKEKYKKSIAEIGLIKGTPQDLSTALNLRRIKDEIKVLEQNAREHENILKRRIADGAKIDFGNDGYISWSGTPRTFRLNLK